MQKNRRLQRKCLSQFSKERRFKNNKQNSLWIIVWINETNSLHYISTEVNFLKITSLFTFQDSLYNLTNGLNLLILLKNLVNYLN